MALPIEIIEMILFNLDVESLSLCCLVSNTFDHIINNSVATKKLKCILRQGHSNVDVRPALSGFSDLNILINIQSLRHTHLISDQWQCYFLIKNASHYQIQYAEDYGYYGDYTRVYPEYDYAKTIRCLDCANYPFLSTATKALAKISADRDADRQTYPCAFKVSTSFDLVEYIPSQIGVYVCHWSIALVD